MLIGFHLGISVTVYAIMSVIRRSEGPGGNTYVPRERYSLTMSFCVVPVSLRMFAAGSSPAAVACSSATTW